MLLGVSVCGLAMSPVGTLRTRRDVRIESAMNSKADVYQALPFKQIFFVLVDGCLLVAGSPVQSCGGSVGA